MYAALFIRQKQCHLMLSALERRKSNNGIISTPITFMGFQPSSGNGVRYRQGGFWDRARIYWPGSGIRSRRDIEQEAICARDGKYPDENPEDWTIWGQRKVSGKDMFHYTDRKAGKGYSDFASTNVSSRPYIWPPSREHNRQLALLTAFLFACLLIDFNWFVINAQVFYRRYFKANAATIEEGDVEQRNGSFEGKSSADTHENHSADETNNCSVGNSGPMNRKKSQNGFSERRIIQYENRIRAYSSPDKIFRYFATVKLLYEDGTFDIFMTPDDFVRSLTPGVMQSRRYGLDKYKVFSADEKVRFTGGNSLQRWDTVFCWMGDSGGLINFGDYLFLMTLLSTSPSEFKLAFHVFDQNGDGVLDQQEFARVQELVLSQSNIGQRHRDHKTGTGAFVKTKNSLLAKHFFGADGSKKLDIDTFLTFQQNFHRDILKIEFERRDPESGPEGIISEAAFAELLMIHSDLSEKRQKRMMKRVRKRYCKDVQDKKGVSFGEVDDFFAFIYHIDKVDLALHFYKLAGKPLSKQLLQRVAKKITGVELTDVVVDIVVTLFDENGDGELSQREFVGIMKKRMQRGLERPKDTGLVRMVDACWQCGKAQLGTLLPTAITVDR